MSASPFAKTAPFVLCLPIADRRTSYAFYGAGLGFETFGEPAEDGVPEPLQLAVNDGVTVMFIPTEGFGWVAAGRKVAESGVSECILSLSAASNHEVDEVAERARQAGADIVTPPSQQPWGYVATFADPDGHLWQVTSTAGSQDG